MHTSTLHRDKPRVIVQRLIWSGNSTCYFSLKLLSRNIRHSMLSTYISYAWKALASKCRFTPKMFWWADIVPVLHSQLSVCIAVRPLLSLFQQSALKPRTLQCPSLLTPKPWAESWNDSSKTTHPLCSMPTPGTQTELQACPPLALRDALLQHTSQFGIYGREWLSPWCHMCPWWQQLEITRLSSRMMPTTLSLPLYKLVGR